MAHPLLNPWFFIPFPRNPDFVGREHELAQLHAALGGADEPVGITPAGLTGMGGIGKTQLAVEYCYRYANAYPGGVFWVNAAEPLRQGLAALGQRLLEAEMEGGEEHQKLVTLRRFIARAFSLEEMADLCFELGISPEEVPGQTASSRARELVTYCEHRARIPALIAAVEAARPGQDWRTGTAESQQRQIEALAAHPSVALSYCV